MILAVFLILAAAVWGGAELTMLVTGTMSVAAGWITTVALFAIGGGVFAARTEPEMARAGRVGIVMIAFAAASYAMVTIIILSSGALGALATGEIGYGDIVLTPFYLLTLVFLEAGLIGFAMHFAKAKSGPAWLAPAFVVLALVHGARLVLPDIFALHAVANFGLALMLIYLGLRALGRARPVRTL